MRLLDPRPLLPPGLVVDAIEPVADRVVILAHAPVEPGPIRAPGIDEWAWRRRQRYGVRRSASKPV